MGEDLDGAAGGSGRAGAGRVAAAVAGPRRPVRLDRGALYARAWEDAGDDAPAVVLVHGMVVSSRYMVPLAERLAGEFRLYAPDLPGFGRSPKPSQPLRLPQLARALGTWLEAVGLERSALLGNSFGCQVLTELAARRPELVERLVLVSPTSDPEARNPVRQLLRWLRELPKELSMAPVMAVDYARAGPRRALATYREMLSGRIEERLPQVTAPTLVVRGGRDVVVPQRWAEEAARLLPQGELVTLPEASHATNWTHPGELAEAVRPFLAAASA